MAIAPEDRCAHLRCECHRCQAMHGNKLKTLWPLPTSALRVLCVEQDGERSRVLERALAAAGHHIVGPCAAHALFEAAARHEPDVIVVDTPRFDDTICACIASVSEQAPRPIVVFTDEADPERIRAALRCGVSSYVVDGWAPERIESVVRVAIARFERDQSIQAERDEAQSKLAERKIIERAKGILMRRRGIGEDEAYHALRRIAMDRNLRMSVVAERLVSMSELFD